MRNKTIAYNEYQIANMARLKDHINKAYNQTFDNANIMMNHMKMSQIQNYIESSKLSNSWKESMYWAMAGWWSIIGHKKNATKFSALSYALKKERDDLEDKGEQTEKEKENYLSLEELKILREQWKDYGTDKNKMYTYLILCFITYQPVLRTYVYTSLKLAKTAKDATKESDDNFIHINRRGKWSGFIYVNTDKVSNTFTHQKNKEIPIIDPTLLKILDKTLTEFPRTDIFDFDIQKAGDKFLVLLRNATKTVGKPLFDIDMARSSYINSLPLNASRTVRKELAKNMRHTIDTQDKSYRKNLVVLEDAQKIATSLDESKKEIISLMAELASVKEEKDKYKLYWNRKREDIIRTANRQKSKIKEINIDEFNIVKINDVYE